MLGFLKRLFGKKQAAPQFTEEEYNRDYELKKAGLERVLGPMHDMVGHAIIPYAVGGTVDMYYFLNGIPGTGFATMELVEPDGSGPKPNRVGTYELVAFTKLPYVERERGAENSSPFEKIERRLCAIFTVTGRYSTMAVLNPGETCEVPAGEGEENRCLVLDEYRGDDVDFRIGDRRHCLLLCIEVFRKEMEYAMEHGSEKLLTKLKEAGHYPYSDLDRDPVV